ncbi:hypothetical protein L3X38_023023 [Prunus dulcis]|uniref:Uncharacterized protein n=1 Tax=Prunus dulcis TaxID=3755 RepID=A0AAD4VX28_PRUDU|nr:hypothetical protein L3X38_023023 [Prunus dulcis]
MMGFSSGGEKNILSMRLLIWNEFSEKLKGVGQFLCGLCIIRDAYYGVKLKSELALCVDTSLVFLLKCLGKVVVSLPWHRPKSLRTVSFPVLI